MANGRVVFNVRLTGKGGAAETRTHARLVAVNRAAEMDEIGAASGAKWGALRRWPPCRRAPVTNVEWRQLGDAERRLRRARKGSLRSLHRFRRRPHAAANDVAVAL